ncbi:MAG: 3-methyl-2-oxobutanoate hydroxymethyltransferase [Candidatus Omnitrophota bacterium]
MTKDKVTVLDFKRKKEAGEKITMLTAYDHLMARIIDRSGLDAILVGDSVGMVMLGYDNTTSVTMDEMIHHSKAVRKGTERAFLIGDMPFMSYQASDEDAVRNAGRFVQEAGCEAVKVEGGREALPRVEAIIAAGIPVLGHIGLTPQSLNKLGGYRVQGRDSDSAAQLMEDAVLLEKAGCFALVLECVPKDLAGKVARKLRVPVIGIGAGVHCDGQVLVTHDIIGYFDRFVPKFVKQYTKVNEVIGEAVAKFKRETESGEFPGDEQSFD